jgi:hypothetical protein
MINYQKICWYDAWRLKSSGKQRHVDLYSVTDVSEKPDASILKIVLLKWVNQGSSRYL